MEVTFQMTAEDYWQFNVFMTKRDAGLRRQSFFRIAFLPAIVVLDGWLMHFSPVLILLLFLVSAAAWTAYIFWASKRAVVRQAEARPGALGLTTVCLGEENMRVQNIIQESIYKWSIFRELAESPQHLIFFIGPRYALIVPKRGFAGADQSAAFLRTATAYWTGDRDGISPSMTQENTVWPPPPRTLV